MPGQQLRLLAVGQVPPASGRGPCSRSVARCLWSISLPKRRPRLMRSALLRARPPSRHSMFSAGSLKNTPRLDRHIRHDDGPQAVLAVQQPAAEAEGQALVGQPPPAGLHLAGQALDVALVDRDGCACCPPASGRPSRASLPARRSCGSFAAIMCCLLKGIWVGEGDWRSARPARSARRCRTARSTCWRPSGVLARKRQRHHRRGLLWPRMGLKASRREAA